MSKLKKLIIAFIDNVFGFFKLLSKEPSVPVMEEIKKRKAFKSTKIPVVRKKRKTIKRKK